MGQPMNYNGFASTYAQTRWAVPWILSPLSSAVSKLPKGAIIIDVGCGTGNYIIELSKEYDNHKFFGFDLSQDMVNVAKSRCTKVEFCIGNADEHFPYANDFANMLFCIDVVHFLVRLDVFFKESYRVLKNWGILIIVTDSEEDIRNRSLSKYFPEALDIELERYPSIEELYDEANKVGFRKITHEETSGYIMIDDEFIDKLDHKCSSALRLISDAAHCRGIQRLKQAKIEGKKWLSRYTVLRFEK